MAKIHQIVVIKRHVRVHNILWVKFTLVMHYVALRFMAQLASPSIYRYALGYKSGAALSPRLMSVKTLSILFSHQFPCAITMAAVAMSSSMSMTFAVSPRPQFHAAIICGSPPSDSFNTTYPAATVSTFSAPCRIRAHFHSAPPFILVIVLALFTGGGRVYPLYRFHIPPYKKAPSRKPFSDDISIAYKSCFIVLTFMGQCDL